MRGHNRIQAHRVIQTGFDMSRAVRRRPVKIAYFDCQRLYAAFKIRSDRRGKNSELIFVRRFYTDNGRTSEHIRPYVQRRTGTVRRYISFIGRYGLRHRIYKTLLRKNRHFQPLTGIFHPLSVQIGAEGNDTSVFRRISFQAFKTGLRIL